MTLRLCTLLLLGLYPVAWCAPLLRAGVLPWFGLSEISVLSGVAALWETAPVFAVIVAGFAFVLPVLKLAGVAAIQWRVAGPRLIRATHLLGRLAMADVFLIAVYITVAKGVSLATVQVAWGLYLFTFCVLGSILLGLVSEARLRQ